MMEESPGKSYLPHLMKTGIESPQTLAEGRKELLLSNVKFLLL